jgi:hypothetical protein
MVSATVSKHEVEYPWVHSACPRKGQLGQMQLDYLDPDNLGSRLLCNICNCFPVVMALYPRRLKSSSFKSVGLLFQNLLVGTQTQSTSLFKATFCSEYQGKD